MTAPTPISRVLIGLVWLITAGLVVQAVLAGQFISGWNNLLAAHQGVGNAMELLSWVLLIVAAADRRTRRRNRRLWLAALLFPIAVTVQAGLGHAPGAVPTAIHVPLGALLVAAAAALSLRLPREFRSS